jgi:peptidoglycan-associated lipoprotein
MNNTFASSPCLALAAALVLAACTTKETPRPVMNNPLTASPMTLPDQAAAPERMTATGPPVGEEPRRLDGEVTGSVLFAFDQSSLDDRAKTILKGQAAWLQMNRGVAVTLEGHCDERGTREYNLALGARRAAAVMDYLVSLGITADRLKTVSFGKERPVCEQSNEACWARNRRSVSLIADAVSSTSVGMRF